MLSNNKRSSMILYASPIDPHAHRVRIVLAEKGVLYDRIDIFDTNNLPEELVALNPYGVLPTFMDRELVVYGSEIIMEYLDERFPHPPLMPVYPIARARSRLMMTRINEDLYSRMNTILHYEQSGKGDEKALHKAVKDLQDGLLSMLPAFQELPYFMSEEYSLVDCCLAPLLWRSYALGVRFTPEAKPLLQYAQRLFAREAFQSSLTDQEKVLGEMSL
jgi:stringent starvation protein A